MGSLLVKFKLVLYQLGGDFYRVLEGSSLLLLFYDMSLASRKVMILHFRSGGSLTMYYKLCRFIRLVRPIFNLFLYIFYF